MGYIADMMMDVAFAQEAEFVSKFNNKMWTQANGVIVEVENMTTTHIINCIKCLKQGRIDLGGWESDWIDLFQSEIKSRKKKTSR